ncbi:heme-degrading domain-containing protein [Massilia sp. ST3]|uniref:heme-degrading domain-containing protein n=1 Tax=Massilia sp. ST3 TaxID=2824903 RepID=UPI001B813864|nr:heme-degrading domain-containing protein [Massilia sp. ST3]MBQ5948671.1 heme-degrading domain-containing protein [Massilia sp. ST3]
MKLLALPLLLIAGAAGAQSNTIKLNQLGFLPQSQKLAVVPQGAGERFEVIGADGKPAFAGKLGAATSWAPSGETVRVADFSWLSKPGAYRLKVEGLPLSDPFTVAQDGYRALNSAALKAFYLNRAGIALDPKHAGRWARPAGHPDDKVLVHASAASTARPAGTVLSSPKGWYDAGDYNKYVVNSGISTYTLLAALEHFPQWFARQDIGIPESGNGVPDILDEAMWNLEWMLSMQDPLDGGVYHKLTNLRFDGMVMPHAVGKEPRYVVAKGTAAALDFAATMAAASRVLAKHDQQWPGMSAKMLAAAERAWQWAAAHPAAVFKNPAGVVTGEYGDAHLEDEFAWAAAELYIATGKEAYHKALRPETVAATAPSWSDVRGLAWMSLAQHRDRLKAPDAALAASRLDGLARQLVQEWRSSGYRVPIKGSEMVWGSNAVILNQAMMLLQAYRLNGAQDYLLAAQSALDYVLGRNATGYSFVTGFGTRSTLHPHHRPSMADGVDLPVPGWLAGGPNPGQQDKKDCPVSYPSALPALSYIDHGCSYAANEVAINWNAPLVYVSAALSELTPKPRTTAMTDTPVPLEVLQRQEQLLQFERFDNDTALEIGLKLIELARASKKAVSVEIARNGTVLFAHGMNGTSRDNSDWIRRKSNLVNRTGHSSFYIHNQVRLAGGDHDAIPALDPREYAAHGGSFPIVLKGSGQVGTITVSGLPGAEDHAMVVAALKDYLKVAEL